MRVSPLVRAARQLTSAGGVRRAAHGAWVPETKITNLPTGLRVASETIPAATVAVGVWIDAGSRYETPETSGVAHFLEHLAFKGTIRRSKASLEEEVENNGAHVNAYTSRESTVYWMKTTEDKTEWALDVLSDLLLNSKLESGAIERERGVILREMEHVNKSMEEYTMDELHDVAFSGQGLGLTILGPIANIKSISRKDIHTYIKTHYTPDRITIVGAGSVDHERFTALAKKYFEPWAVPDAEPAFNTLEGEKSPEKLETAANFRTAVFTPGERRQDLEKQDLCHIAFAFEGAGWRSPYALPLQLMQDMMGTQYDRLAPVHVTPFFSEVGARGLLHNCNATNISYKDTGVFGLYLKADPRDMTRDPVPEPVLPAMMEAIIRHYTRFAYDVSEEELYRAKVNLKSVHLATTETFERIAEELGRQMLAYDRRMPAAEAFERIDSITVEDIKETARAICLDVDHVMVAAGKVDGLPTYEWISERNRVALLDPSTGYDWRLPWGGLPRPDVEVQRLSAVA
eukprot:scaffold2342_cov368-Pinguiococcus_pyrenoidosus.AAC.3